ncbi:hypothetical protein [Idiomarina aquatica]|uniref:Uncharacterized protein n=1 Tax=Idiomarina aquatica TaxID=1327752 RepID=A0AA94JEJ5_9GAMM|nr:hypothetical protein [Idiomarina aquatica]RUO44716.1 hypothetical protein CWE23_01385 [Idiomarina aquatica]
MKKWIYPITLVISITSTAVESSEKDYLEEVNKAFRTVAEETKNKTLTEKISVLNRLLNEFSDNEIVHDALLQEIGTTYSFMGEYNKALASFDKRGLAAKTIPQDVKTLVPDNARSALANEAEKYQIVMINEAHHVPQHRVFTHRLLDDLWQRGYRYLALEALSENAEHELDKGYVSEKTGFYTAEPIFANLVLHAKRLGFQLVSYDYGSDVSGDTEAREKAAVNNLRDKVFNQEPEAKVVIHVGYSHIDESAWLAHYIKASLNSDPLTINQTDIAQKSEAQFESETYTWLAENHSFEHPFVLTDSDGELWSLKPDTYDVNVVWPRTSYQSNRPEWARLDRQQRIVDKQWCKGHFPCTVEVFRVGRDNEIPADRVIVSKQSKETAIFISDDSGLIQVSNAQGDVIHTEVLK